MTSLSVRSSFDCVTLKSNEPFLVTRKCFSDSSGFRSIIEESIGYQGPGDSVNIPI